MMRILLILVPCIVSIVYGRDIEAPRSQPISILFVGNSLTYVGNLPAVFDALSQVNGLATASDMIVVGGGTLTDRVGDGSVAAALAARKYSYVVLQERGGDFMCGFGPEVCVNARASLATLTRLAQSHGAVPILLGTYQGHPQASKSIVQAESLAAREAGLDYIAVSERLQELRSQRSSMEWFASDGMHPGSDLTLLDAILLFESIHNVKPGNSAFVVSAPIYTFKSPLKAEVRAADAPARELDIAPSARYESERISAIMEILK